MSRLEDFIQNNKEAFNDDIPDKKVWYALEKELLSNNKTKERPFHFFILKWMAAAAIIITISASAWYLFYQTPGKGAIDLSKKSSFDIPKEYEEEMYHFNEIIHIKYKELEKLKEQEPVLYQQFSSDIQQLDSAYNALKFQLPSNPNQEQLLEAMIQNLHLQIDLLNKQLNIIQKIKTQSHEVPFKNI